MYPMVMYTKVMPRCTEGGRHKWYQVSAWGEQYTACTNVHEECRKCGLARYTKVNPLGRNSVEYSDWS